METHVNRPRIKVFLSLAPPDGTTRYVVQLVEGAPAEVEFIFFSWWSAFFSRFDVFHVHWPEYLVRGRNPLVHLVRATLFSLLMLRLRLAGIPIVRTAHNLFPHEPGTVIERALLHLCDKQTTLFIRLNSATDMQGRNNVVTILHGHYKDRFAHIAAPASIPGRALYFGLIRPYKGVEDLLKVFSSIGNKDISLRVVGKPFDSLGELVEHACGQDSRVSSLLRFVEDDVLVHEIGLSQMVVLPYKEMHNSGALLVALSLARPVLVPLSESNRLMAEEVGYDWLLTYEGEITSEILEQALMKTARAERADAPNLKGRDWAVIGELHYQAYLQAMALIGRT